MTITTWRVLNIDKPGWLCEHGFSRDICRRPHAPQEKKDCDDMKKKELVELLRQWIASDGIEVSEQDSDGKSFLIRLPCDPTTTTPNGTQVYQLTISIPRDKASFVLAPDWAALQAQDDPAPGEASERGPGLDGAPDGEAA